MDIINSSWLIQMLKKAGKTPEARMLSLFDIIDDWTEAPGVSNQFNSESYDAATALKIYLTLEAAKAGAALPEMLATQLHIMAASAMHEKLIGQNKTSLIHAKSAAEALIKAQTKKEFHIAKSSAYAIAASFIGILIFAGSLFIFDGQSLKSNSKEIIAAQNNGNDILVSKSTASPQSTVALMQQIEQMRNGNCQLLEAIQLPDHQKSIYFQNIVLGQISTDPKEQLLVRELLGKIRCNYTPMLMKKST
jgi:hypothetical protein